MKCAGLPERECRATGEKVGKPGTPTASCCPERGFHPGLPPQAKTSREIAKAVECQPGGCHGPARGKEIAARACGAATLLPTALSRRSREYQQGSAGVRPARLWQDEPLQGNGHRGQGNLLRPQRKHLITCLSSSPLPRVINPPLALPRLSPSLSRSPPSHRPTVPPSHHHTITPPHHQPPSRSQRVFLYVCCIFAVSLHSLTETGADNPQPDSPHI